MMASSPADVAVQLSDYMDMPNEVFIVLFLNVYNKVIGYTEFTGAVAEAGTVSEVVVDPSDVFQAARRVGATGVITVHNHPSGVPMPSPDDWVLWTWLREYGKLNGIPVVDNLVIARNGRYFSQFESEAR